METHCSLCSQPSDQGWLEKDKTTITSVIFHNERRPSTQHIKCTENGNEGGNISIIDSSEKYTCGVKTTKPNTKTVHLVFLKSIAGFRKRQPITSQLHAVHSVICNSIINK